MIMIVHVSLALYPSEKHFQIENETGQPCCAMWAAAVIFLQQPLLLGWDRHFSF